MQVFWSIALYLGDGGYQIVKMGVISFTHWMMQRHGAEIGEESDNGKDSDQVRPPPPSFRLACDETASCHLRTQSPRWLACAAARCNRPRSHCLRTAQMIRLQHQIACCISRH